MISIIVPVYKVEKYLKRCVDSILNQSYKDIEIILVDDGSPDNCPKMCDDYAMLDNRIITLHKENGGLSSARNYGLKNIHGDYIFFIDSDDWLANENVLSNFIQKAEQEKSDLVFGLINTASDVKITPKKMNRKFNSPDLFLFSNPYLFTAWNKLFSKSLICYLNFTEGRINEDVDIIPLVVSKAKNVSLLDEYTYNYYVNYNSITRKDFSEKRFDMFLSVQHVLQNFDGTSKQKDILFQNMCGFQIFSVFLSILRITDLKKRKFFIKEFVKLLKKYDFPSFFYYLFKCIIMNESFVKKGKKIIVFIYLYILTLFTK